MVTMFAGTAQVVAPASNIAFLAGSLDKLTKQCTELLVEVFLKVQTTAATLLCMSQGFAINGGRSICATQVSHWYLRLGLSNLKENE